MTTYTPSYEVFILLEPAEKLNQSLIGKLSDLAEPFLPVVATDVYYREETDSALLAIRLDRSRMNPASYDRVVTIAERAGTPLIDPARLPREGRENFFSLQRQHYFPEGTNMTNVRDALSCLVDRTPFAAGTDRLTTVARHPRLFSRSDTSNDMLRNTGTFGEDFQTEVETTAPGTVPTRSVPERQSIQVSVLRNGQWLPVRLRTLSSKRAYVVTGALPRVGDDVYLALGFGEDTVVVGGKALLVTSPADAARTGCSGFAVEFPQGDGPAKDALHQFLRFARDNGALIHPPPSRTSIRLPVSWPVRIRSGGKRIQTTALDFSRDGAYLSTDLQLDGEIEFEIPTDSTNSVITGVAKVMRVTRGARSGIGVSFERFSRPLEAKMYRSFLQRVTRRLEKQIVIGAEPLRCGELSRALTALGYSIIVGTDPGMLIQQAESCSKPPDAAIIDHTLTAGIGNNWVEHVYASRKVPCITADAESVARTRAVVDRLLKVDAPTAPL